MLAGIILLTVVR